MGGLGAVVVLGLIGWAVWSRRSDGTREGLEEALDGAVRAGIIDDDQRGRILAHTQRREARSHVSAAAWLAILAGLFVVAGTSLLIATNWEQIGPLVRIASFLLLLAATGEGAIRMRERGTILAVSLELVWLVVPLLGIGLYAQTFQLSGDPIAPFLVWLAVVSPIAWASTHPLVRLIHTSSIVVVLFVGSFLADGALSLRGDPSAARWCLSLATLGAAILQNLRLFPVGQRYHCIGVAVGWLLGAMLSTELLGIESVGWFAVIASSLATLWLVAVLWLEGGPGEVLPPATAWLGVSYATSFAWHVTEPAGGSTAAAGKAAALFLLAAALGCSMRVPLTGLAGATAGRAVARVLLALPAVLCLLLVVDRPEVFHATALLANAFLLAVAIALLWNGSVMRRVRQVNAGTLVLLVVLVTRFVDVLGSFVESGLGFIAAGLLLAGLAWALERTRRRLLDGPEGSR